MARNYVVALLQRISFDEFLPNLLGEAQQDAWIGPYVYQNTVNPDLFTEFNTAGYRIGHVLMNSPYRLIDDQGIVLKRLNLG
jgi:peroxidase